jgi:hypothetical protein
MQSAFFLERMGRQHDALIRQTVPGRKASDDGQHKNEREMHAPDNQYHWQICLHNFFGLKPTWDGRRRFSIAAH